MKEELSRKLDNVLEKAGLSSRYQIIMVLLFIFQFTINEYFDIAVPYLDDLPYVFIPNKLESQILTFEICDENIDFKIDKTKTFHSLVVDLEIYCDKTKINFIEIGYLISSIFGCFFTYIFADYLGRRKTILSLIPINIISSLIFGFFKFKNFKFMMGLLMLIGFTNYIIMITLIIYICEVVEHENIPIFICLIVSGYVISEIIIFICYNITIKSWQRTTIYYSIFNIFIYLLIFVFLIESPVYNLLNGKIEEFKDNIKKIAKFNKKNIYLEDFEFLSDFQEKKKKKNQKKVEKLLINEDEKEDNENDIFIKSTNSSEVQMEIIDEKNPLSKIVFGKFKMKDYTPFHLIKSKEQISNFLILSYIWTACLIIKDGINFHKKTFLPNSRENIITLISFFADFIGFFIILLFFSSGKLLIHPTLVGLQLLSFMVLSFSLIERNREREIKLIYVSEVCWNCLYLLLYIITTIIYPSVIRTKGLSINRGFGKLGTLMGPLYFRERDNENILILFHLILAFFSIVFSYGLPRKIDFLIFESNNKENEDKSKDDDDDNYEEKYQKIMKEKEENIPFKEDNSIGDIN